VAIVIIVFAIASFAKFIYENRCHLLDCTPASWTQILNMAFAKSGADFRIQTIWATPSRWNRYTENGPTFIDIHVAYISPKADPSRINKETNHPTKDIEFDNQNLVFDIRTGNSWTDFVPPEDRQEILQRVSVHPRDAFYATWALAIKESGLPPNPNGVIAILNFDEHGYESVWYVSYYYDNKVSLTFYVDTQTAQIISVEKNDLSQ
jgi:hypothetical protein